MSEGLKIVPGGDVEILWEFFATPSPETLAPQVEYPRPVIPRLEPQLPDPKPWGGLGLARLFAILSPASTAAAVSSIIGGDSPIREPKPVTAPKWRIGDLDPATHQRLEQNRRTAVIQWLESEKNRAWAQGDFLRVNRLQMEITHLGRIGDPFSVQTRMLQAVNSADGTDGQKSAPGDIADHLREKKLRLIELARSCGVIPHGLPAEIFEMALEGSPVVQALLLRTPALGDSAGPLWSEHVHLRMLWAIATYAKDTATRVFAVYQIVREIEHRVTEYHTALKQEMAVTEELRARLQLVAEAVAVLITLANSRTEAGPKAKDSLDILVEKYADQFAIRRLMRDLIQDPQVLHNVMQFNKTKLWARGSLRDVHTALSKEEVLPVDLPSALEMGVTPHAKPFFEPAGDPEAVFSMLWPAPYDNPVLWDRLIREWGSAGFTPHYYQEEAQLLPLVDRRQLRDGGLPERFGDDWTPHTTIFVNATSLELFDYLRVGRDPQHRFEAAARLLDKAVRRPWPSEVLALSHIAIRDASLTSEIIQGLKDILLAATTTTLYQNTLAPGAAEAAFDGLMRIATAWNHVQAEVARRALWEVGREAPRVAARLKKVQWGKGYNPVVPLHSRSLQILK